MKWLKIILFPLLAAAALNGQTSDHKLASIDSLEQKIKQQRGEEKINSLILLSELYRKISFDKSVKTGFTAINEAAKIQSHALAAKAYQSMGYGARQTGDYELSDEFFEKALESNEKTSNELARAYIINNMAYNLSERSFADEAIIKFNQALELANKHNDDTLRMLIHLNLGKIEYNKAEFSNAFDFFQKASQIAIQLNDDHGLAKAQQNLAMIYWQWDENDKAIQMLHEIIPVFVRYSNDENLSMIYNNLGLIFLNDKRLPDSAFRYFDLAKVIREANGWNVALANVLSNMALAYAAKDKHPEAIEVLEKALDIYINSSVYEGVIRTHLRLGNIHQQLGNYSKSNHHLRLSLETGKLLGIHQYNQEIFEILMKNYIQLNDFDRFQEVFLLFKAEHDAMAMQYNDLQSTEAAMKDQIVMLTEKNLNQSNQLSELQKKIRHQHYLLGAMGAIMIFIIFTSLFIMLGRKRNSQKQTTQQMKIIQDEIN